MSDLHIYATREAALSSKWAVAAALGKNARDLVVVRHGGGYAIRDRSGLDRWLASKRR
jgi:hypothetical protein